MLPYARLTPGSGFRLSRTVFYYAQRLASVPIVRRVLSALIAAGVRVRHGVGDWAAAEDHDEVLGALRRDGLALMRPLVSDDQIFRILDYFRGQPVIGPDDEAMQLDLENPPGATVAYNMETVLGCPGLFDIVNAPAVLRIATDYLGCKPTISSLGVRWSFPISGEATRTQGFHRDVDDWRFLKLFIYLTDVDESAGPHCYVRTSHVSAFSWSARAYGQVELERRFGQDKVQLITGARGTTFMADTIGVHRGVPPSARARLILQVQYSLLPVFAFLYSPAGHPPAGEPYCNRLL